MKWLGRAFPHIHHDIRLDHRGRRAGEGVVVGRPGAGGAGGDAPRGVGGRYARGGLGGGPAGAAGAGIEHRPREVPGGPGDLVLHVDVVRDLGIGVGVGSFRGVAAGGGDGLSAPGFLDGIEVGVTGVDPHQHAARPEGAPGAVAQERPRVGADDGHEHRANGEGFACRDGCRQVLPDRSALGVIDAEPDAIERRVHPYGADAVAVGRVVGHGRVGRRFDVRGVQLIGADLPKRYVCH